MFLKSWSAKDPGRRHPQTTRVAKYGVESLQSDRQ